MGLSSKITTKGKLILLASLYFSQGLPMGFFHDALPVLLRERGLSLTAIGFSSFLALPWALKFLWAPLVDRYSLPGRGRRKSWIVPLQALGAGNLLAMGLLDPSQSLALLAGLVLLANLFAATQDIATDGLAVSLLEFRERGWGNGIQVAGYRLGMIAAGGLLLALLEFLGWRMSFMLMAALMAAASLPVLLHREQSSQPSGEAVKPPTLAETLGFLRRPGIGVWLFALLAYKTADDFGTMAVKPFLRDFGLDKATIGMMANLGSLASLLGALAGGYGVSRLGRRWGFVLCGSIQATAMGLYALPASGIGGEGLLWALEFIEAFASSMVTAALFTMMMDACRPKTGATDYTIQASIFVVAKGLGNVAGGVSADALGYAMHYGLAMGLAFGCLAWVAAGPGLRERESS